MLILGNFKKYLSTRIIDIFRLLTIINEILKSLIQKYDLRRNQRFNFTAILS